MASPGIISSDQELHVLLQGGWGNKLNYILNSLHLRGKKVYIWFGGQRGFPIVPGEDVLFPGDPTFIDKGGYDPKKRHAASFHLRDGVTPQMVEFVKGIQPGPEVAEMIPKERFSIGYHVRALHPKSLDPSTFKPEEGSFLASDWHKVRNQHKGSVNTIPDPGMMHDRDRSRQNALVALAEWFTLRDNCDEVRTFGIPFSNMSDIHSTFVDGIRVAGVPVTCITPKDLPKNAEVAKQIARRNSRYVLASRAKKIPASLKDRK